MYTILGRGDVREGSGQLQYFKDTNFFHASR